MNRKSRGSVTVEASLVVPLFLFFMMSLGSLFMLLMAEAHIHQSLAEAADYVAGASYLAYKTKQPDVADAVGMNVQFRKYLGDDFYVSRTVKGKKNGIVIIVRDDRDNPRIFHAKAEYLAGIDLPFMGRHYIHLTNEIKQKRFIGYSPEEQNDAYVYVTPERSVYHVSRGCTHLSVQYGGMDSSQKSRYTPCRFCGKEANDMGRIYVSRTTNVYHFREGCSGLKRTVIRIKKEEAAGLPVCSRCGR